MSRTLSLLCLVLCFYAGVVAAGALPGGLNSEAPTLRLPEGARPLGYSLHLTLQPDQASFSGTITIDTEITKPISTVWLNASNLTVQEASYTPKGGAMRPARPQVVGNDFLGLAFDHALAPGRGQTRLRFKGRFSQKDSHGLFTQKDGDEWYAYSQFESTYARQAFPCFDEPSFKVPWQLTLHIPQGHKAFSNTPEQSRHRDSAGLQAVTFVPTKPLPSYLVAMGVGPFEVVSAGQAGRKKTPLRIIVPKGHAAEVGYAAQCIPALFERLERYFGTSYPYEKLDHLAIPQTVGFGAMENPGLITYNAEVLLARPQDRSVAFSRECAQTAAHEMAHMWFGDLVTMAWWNDLWLNEAFATWMEAKVVGEWKPEWEGTIAAVSRRGWAMGSDSLVTARMIRQPIASRDDIENAFDGITYTKGAAVLSMFESHLGASRFRQGVRHYLQQHAHGNATTGDFLKALAEQGDKGLPAAFSTFLDQAGVPLVTAQLVPGAGAETRLRLTQKRYLPAGSSGSSRETWQVPVRIRYAAAGTVHHLNTVLKAGSQELVLPVATANLDYVLVNEGMAGYFATVYKDDLLERLLKDGARALRAPERVGVLKEVGMAVATGELSKRIALDLVPRFSGDPQWQVVESMASITRSIGPHLVREDLRPNYARFIEKTFGAKARALGFLPKVGESEGEKLLRQSLVGLVASEAEDPVLCAEARDLALSWIDQGKGGDPDVLGMALDVTAAHGDRVLFDRYLQAAKASKDVRDTSRLLGALGAFDDPVLVNEALGVMLTDTFDSRQSIGILWSGLSNRKARQASYAFVKKNIDPLMAKLPREYGAYLPFVGGSFCDAESRADLEGFFKDRVAEYPGAPRNLAQTLESISLCEANRLAQQGSVSDFLQSQ